MCTEGIQGFLLARQVLYRLGYVHFRPLRYIHVSGTDSVRTITGLESKLLLGQTKMKIAFEKKRTVGYSHSR